MPTLPLVGAAVEAEVALWLTSAPLRRRVRALLYYERRALVQAADAWSTDLDQALDAGIVLGVQRAWAEAFLRSIGESVSAFFARDRDPVQDLSRLAALPGWDTFVPSPALSIEQLVPPVARETRLLIERLVAGWKTPTVSLRELERTHAPAVAGPLFGPALLAVAAILVLEFGVPQTVYWALEKAAYPREPVTLLRALDDGHEALGLDTPSGMKAAAVELRRRLTRMDQRLPAFRQHPLVRRAVGAAVTA